MTNGPPTGTKQLSAVTPETVRALFEAADVRGSHTARVRNKAILFTLFDTGIRSGELCSLDIGDYDERTGGLMIQRGKTPRSSRLVFLGKRSGEAMHQ